MSLSFIIAFLLLSCQTPKNKNQIYFGGEILNPKSQYVLLMQNDKVLDSIKLKADNTFEKYFDSLQPGLYFFMHSNEFQYVFFEPKDSIRIRLNTWDFDETLVFDGKGSEKNDFLLSVFLQNEKEMDNFYSYFPLSETEFTKKYEEALLRNKSVLNQFFESNPNFSPQFKKLAEGAVTYPLYRFKELYPYYHQKLNKNDSILQVSPEFYNFRKNVNLNDPQLIEYYAYQNYISSYLYNEANTKNNYKAIDENYKKILLNLIVEKIENQELKNRLLYQEIFNSLFKSTEKLNKENFDLFYANCTDIELKNKIINLVDLKEKLPNQTLLPDFELINFQKNRLSISHLIEGKPSVLYFWSMEKTPLEFMNKRIKYLSSLFPNIQFVGIQVENLNSINDKSYFFPQYYLPENSYGNTLISNDFPRAILLDKKGMVVQNFSLLFDIPIEKQLESLSKKATPVAFK